MTEAAAATIGIVQRHLQIFVKQKHGFWFGLERKTAAGPDFSSTASAQATSRPHPSLLLSAIATFQLPLPSLPP